MRLHGLDEFSAFLGQFRKDLSYSGWFDLVVCVIMLIWAKFVGVCLKGWNGRSRSLNGVRGSHCLLSKFTGNIGWLSVSVPVASALTGLAPIPSLRWGQPHKPVSTSLWRGCVRIPSLPPGYCYRPLDFFYQPGGHSDVLGNDMFVVLSRHVLAKFIVWASTLVNL